MPFRTNPGSNYYMMGEHHFGPFAFIISEDQRAEHEFKQWLDGSKDSLMPYGVRPAGKYSLWRQPITALIEDVEEDDGSDDELVAMEPLQLTYDIRPAVDYSEYRFLGHVGNWHKDRSTAALGVEDIFLVSAYRADRVMLFGVYAEPTEENPRPWWSSWFNTTMPAYGPEGRSLLHDLGSLVAAVDVSCFGTLH